MERALLAFGILAVIFFGLLFTIDHLPNNNKEPIQVQSSTGEGYEPLDIRTPEEINGTAGKNEPPTSQSYWYCWDKGDPSPHHLGYPVDGDHICNDLELSNAGIN